MVSLLVPQLYQRELAPEDCLPLGKPMLPRAHCDRFGQAIAARLLRCCPGDPLRAMQLATVLTAVVGIMPPQRPGP